MSAHRRPLVALELVSGFVLSFGLLGCHHRINNHVALPENLFLSPKPGDVLTWKRTTPQIENFKLTFQDGFCELTPNTGTENGDKTISITATGDEVVECKVLPVSEGRRA